MLLSCLWLCFFAFQSYVADLTARMTARAPEVDVRSFQDVLDLGYRVHTPGGTVYESILANSAAGTSSAEVYRDNLRVVNGEADDVAEELVRLAMSDRRNVAFESTYSFLAEDRLKPLLHFREKMVGQLGFGLRKDSEFKEVFDYHLIRIKQVGFVPFG